MIEDITQLHKNSKVNYSDTVVDGKILPFLVELDTAMSDLYPSSGQNQKFCYRVTSLGKDKKKFVDLSCIVFGICDKISKEQIENISVSIDGEQRDIYFCEHGNVSLNTFDSQFCSGGYSGILFDFELSKVAGIMIIYFELNTPYLVGETEVCLYGDEIWDKRIARGLTIQGPLYPDTDTCNCTAYQKAKVHVPVSVKPFACTGKVTTKCCEEPVLISTSCRKEDSETCDFKVKVKICVEIPVKIGAITKIGKAMIDCGDLSVDGCGECCRDT